MNKKELVTKITELLKENNIRKYVPVQKTTLHISDDDGNQSDFVIRKEDRGLLFTTVDVTAFVDALLAVVNDSIKHGEDISISGYGTLGVHYRKARKTIHPETHEEIDVSARYVPKFTFGNTLRTAAKIYEISQLERDGMSIDEGLNNGD